MANPEIGMTCKSIDILLPTCIFHIKNKVEGVTNNCRRQHCKEIFIALSISRYVHCACTEFEYVSRSLELENWVREFCKREIRRRVDVGGR